MRLPKALLGYSTALGLAAVLASPLALSQTMADDARTPDKAPGGAAIKAESDAEIMGLLIALDDNEIGAANQAMKQSNMDAKVLELAKTIEQDHSKDRRDTKELAQKIGVEPAMATAAVNELKAKGQQTMTSLSSPQGKPAGDVFVSQMVAGHREALVMLDGFLDTAQHPELKTQLTNARQHVAMHLQQAEQLATNAPGSR